MSSQFHETLSAVVDGEASQFETRRVLDELARDPALRDRWHRYHLIGALIRREGESVEHEGALARFWAAVDGAPASSESVPDSDAVRSRRRGRATAGAVAATVALGIVIGFYPRAHSPSETTLALLGSEPPSVTEFFAEPRTPVATPAESRLVRVLPSESDLARTRAYMLHHAHHTAINQRTAGAVPFVKVAAFESR